MLHLAFGDRREGRCHLPGKGSSLLPKAKVYGRTETEASQDCADSTSVLCCGVRAGGHLIYT